MTTENEILVLAWGNPGRLDDGLGPAFAEIAAGWDLEGLTVDSDYQLTVEDADRVSRFRRVVFVDADRTCAAPFRVERIRAGKSGMAFSSHSVTPESVLALARDLFRSEPEAWLVGIRGHEFDEFGERLSRDGSANLQAAAAFLETSLREDRMRGTTPHETEKTHVG